MLQPRALLGVIRMEKKREPCDGLVSIQSTEEKKYAWSLERVSMIFAFPVNAKISTSVFCH